MFAIQTIKTQYRGPTNHSGAKCIATTGSGGSFVSVSYDHSIDVIENHAIAAHKLAEKLGWIGDYAIGSTKTGYVFTLVTADTVVNLGFSTEIKD